MHGTMNVKEDHTQNFHYFENPKSSANVQNTQL
jgi:hypothetical protein